MGTPSYTMPLESSYSRIATLATLSYTFRVTALVKKQQLHISVVFNLGHAKPSYGEYVKIEKKKKKI
jgi:hypothetical protein